MTPTELQSPKPLSRAELATIFVKMFGLTGRRINTYADLKGDEWYADAILKHGRRHHAGRRRQQATAEISRAETMVMFRRAMGVTPPRSPDMSRFTDADEVPAWAAGYMAPWLRWASSPAPAPAPPRPGQHRQVLHHGPAG